MRRYDVNPESVQELAGEGAVGAASLAEMVEKLAPPRHVWVMVPAAITPKVVHEIADLLDPNDTIIDGGNSYYKDHTSAAGPAAAGHPLHRLRHERRRVGTRARLLPDDRR